MAELTLQEAYNQAKAALEAGAGERAVAIGQHLLRYYPRYVEGYRLLGEVYLEQGAWAEAGQLFTHVLNCDPQNVLAHVGRAIIAEELDQIDEAVAELERGFEVDPAIGELRAELLRLYKELYGAAGASVRLTPLGLAYTHLRAGLLETAIAEFLRIGQALPDRWDAQVALLEAVWRNEQLADTALLAGEILAEHPNCVKANWLLGYLHWTEGRLDTGRAYLTAAVALDPDYGIARKLWASTPWPLDSVLTTEQPALVPGWESVEPVAADLGLALPVDRARRAAALPPYLHAAADLGGTADIDDEPVQTLLPAWAIGATQPPPAQRAVEARPPAGPALRDWFNAWVATALATAEAEPTVAPTNGWTDQSALAVSLDPQDDLIDFIAGAADLDTQDDLIDLIDALTRAEARAVGPPAPADTPVAVPGLVSDGIDPAPKGFADK